MTIIHMILTTIIRLSSQKFYYYFLVAKVKQNT